MKKLIKKIYFKCLLVGVLLVFTSCSNTEEGNTSVEVDTENPIINCPNNISIAVGATESNPIVEYDTPVGMDNVNAITTQVEGLASGSAFPEGITINIFKATDAAGNSATCSFDVVVTRSAPADDWPYFIGSDPTPSGKTWEFIPELTDEFEGTEIDTKWHTEPATHPHLKWVGRSPAMFRKENVKLNNGELTIEVNKLPAPVTASGWGLNGTPVDYTFSGGNIRSLVTTNVGNFYECKMKMNKTEMGGGFWLMGFNNTCGKKHEIDITESVGIESETMASWAKTRGWTEIYHSNSIRREDSCDSDQERDSDHITTPTKNHEKYYVYGCWRKSATELLFYLDGEYQYTLNPPVPFDQEMYLQFSIESYDWNPIPANGSFVETASQEDRTTYIEYIRSFKLIDE